MPFQFALERMQPESRQIHIIRFSTTVQNREDIA